MYDITLCMSTLREVSNFAWHRIHGHQRWARIRTGSGLKPILAGSGLDQTAIFFKLADQDWIGLRKFWLF